MSEDKPHILFANGQKQAFVFPDYKSAFIAWQEVHTYETPWLIAVRGRVIDPSTPVIDVNE